MIEFDQEAILRFQKQLTNVKNRFGKLAGKFQDMSPVFKSFKNEYSEIVNANFKSSGRIMERQHWKEYTPAYLKFKQKHYPGKPKLVVTGELKNKAINFNAKISKKNMKMEVKGKDYFYYVSDRERYGRKYFYTKDEDMPIQAWRILIQVAQKHIMEGQDG